MLTDVWRTRSAAAKAKAAARLCGIGSRAKPMNRMKTLMIGTADGTW